MTDERIKEEFEKGKSNPENVVTAHYQKLIAEYDAVDKAAAIGYYMKCKTAERLAKIEALEELREVFLSNGSKITTMVKLERMISELKEAGE